MFSTSVPRVIRRATVLLVVPALLSACQLLPTAMPTASKHVLRIGLQGYPESFNVNLDHNAPGFSVYRMLFDKLSNADVLNGGALGPELATSWSLVDDTTWRFNLRKDVKWSDGSDFTAADVVATIDLTLNGKPPALMASRIGGVTDAAAVDPYTVDIHTKTKNAILPVGLADIYIYQAKQINAGGNQAIQQSPVVTGMFKVAGREEGVSVTLEPNPYYWGTKSTLDQVVFKPYPEDATRVAALQTGEIDIAYTVPPDDSQVLQSKGFSLASTPIGQSMVLNLKTVNPDTPLAKQGVRQALNYAIDKEAIVKDVMLGFGKPLPAQLVGPDGVGFNSQIQAYPYDPARAKQMLADAGYPNGFAITLYTSQGRYVKQKEASEAIAGQLRQVGLDVTMNLQDFSSFFVGSPNYDMYYSGWNYFPTMDADFVLQQFVCTSQFKVMCNQEFDSLFQQERQEADPAKRSALLQQMQVIVHDQAPAIFMFQAPDIFGVSSHVKGFKPTPDDVVHVDGVTVDASQ
jgi:peptide/nickel transport system substrate-binding protein